MRELIRKLTTEEGLIELFEAFADFGVLVGFFLVLMESFLPILPLFVIVILNINAYGFIVGFLISYGGTVLGGYLVFLLIRRLFRERARKYINRNRKLSRFRDYLNHRGFIFMFIMLALPFTPTSVITVLAAITDINRRAFLYLLALAKVFMIGSMALVGFDLTGYFDSPIRLGFSVVFVVLLYFISKWYQGYVDKKVKRRQVR